MSTVQLGALHEHHFEVSCPLVALIELLVRSLVGMFLPLFCVLELETSNGLMPAARELMMLNKLLILLSVEHPSQKYFLL